MSELIFGTDDYYGIGPVDYRAIKDGGGTFVIHKASSGLRPDPMFESNCEAADKVGLINGAYHWDDPLVNDYQQAAYFNERVRGKVSFVMNDVEQWWADWYKWNQAARKIIPWSAVPHLSSSRIIQSGMRTSEIIADGGLPFLTYSAAWFTAAHARDLGRLVLNKYHTCLASYPFASGRQRITWADMVLILEDHQNKKPIYPAGVDHHTIWQITGDKFILPGNPSPADVNLFNGDQTDWENFLAGKPMVFKPYLVSVTAVLGLRVRTGPGTVFDRIGSLPYGTKVTIEKEQEGWGYFTIATEGGPFRGSGWISLAWVKRI